MVSAFRLGSSAQFFADHQFESRPDFVHRLIVCRGFYVPANNIAWADDFNADQQQASESGKPIILFFTGKWCVPCRIMKRNVWANEQVTASVNASFIPVLIDVDDSDSATALSRYSVGATPMTIITDAQGKVLHQVAGGMGKTDFLELLSKLNPTAGEPRFVP